ncbi:hypothetical protein CRE_00912 [Caenorhabditis remanei]|uniref:Uncharacterized protein n=1 Tax=Caenorhabditis remanei TaxID=31234 RepID=E3LCG9_CAERE|nr:hypothetical protein CRE_00912 [Caenorhabditis remanei]
MDFKEEWKNLLEIASQLDWVHLTFSNIPAFILIIYCTGGFVASYLFKGTPMPRDSIGEAAKMTRFNFGLLIITAWILIARNSALETNYDDLASCFTNLLNFNLFFICIVDLISLFVQSFLAIRVAVGTTKKEKTIWCFFLSGALITALAVTCFTFQEFRQTYYDEQMDFPFQNLIYGAFSLLMVLGAIGAHYLEVYLKKSADTRYSNGFKHYYKIYKQFKIMYDISKYTGINAAFKSIAMLSMMFFSQSQRIYHATVLFYFTFTTTLCFFALKESRIRLFELFGLQETYFGRMFMGLRKSGTLEEEPTVTPEAFMEDLERQWEEEYEKKMREQNQTVFPAQQKMTLRQIFRRAKTLFETLAVLMERKRVGPVTHSSLFMVTGSSNPSLTTIC